MNEFTWREGPWNVNDRAWMEEGSIPSCFGS